MTVPPGAANFFSTMRERHAIYLRRKAGLPAPWTDDPVMREYSITNPFRENDKTTQHLKRIIREPLRDKPEVLLAIVVYRWFNRIQTGTAVFQQTSLVSDPPCQTAFEQFLQLGTTDVLRDAIVASCGRGPYVTGSYIIQGWRGMSKLDGVLKCVEEFYRGTRSFDGSATPEAQFGWREAGEWLLENHDCQSLEYVWRWLRQFPYLGDFMAHEIVQDLRYTDLLCHASDVNTWSNPGPGAERGLARVYGRDIVGNIVRRTPKAQLIAEMRELLELSRSPEYWPQETRDRWVLNKEAQPHDWNMSYMLGENAWPRLELHQIEMWLCEASKIIKTRLGEGRPRGKFRSV